MCDYFRKMPSYKVHKAHRTDSDPFFFKVADRLDWDRNMIACVLCEFFCSFFLIVSFLALLLRLNFSVRRTFN